MSDTTEETATVQALTRRLREVRDRIDQISNGELKTLKSEKLEIERELMRMMVVGQKIAFDGVASISVKEELVPGSVDWDVVLPYIRDNDAFFLLPKKINAAPFRELHEQLAATGEAIPGVTPAVIRRLNYRKAG